MIADEPTEDVGISVGALDHPRPKIMGLGKGDSGFRYGHFWYRCSIAGVYKDRRFRCSDAAVMMESAFCFQDDIAGALPEREEIMQEEPL